jgi:tol-pal system protein YbgF
MASSVTREGDRKGSMRGAHLWGAVLCLCLALTTGCVTKGDFMKLEERVMDIERTSTGKEDPFSRIAELSSEVAELREEQRILEGKLEVSQKTADDALDEASKAREALAAQGLVSAAVVGVGASTDTPGDLIDPLGDDGTTSEEVVAYQAALNAWRGDEHKTCIEQFRKFLQTYPASPYADDAAYWMADCHFKEGDYRVAVLRFNDVVRVYPTGNKAPDALYRQGESLLKLGPGFYDAATTVFKQVLKDYPDSARAREAQQQLEAIGSG